MTRQKLWELQGYYDKYHKSVFHTAFIIIKNTSVAEDVLQEIFLKLINSYENEIEITNVGAWLITCTKNYCYNYQRDSYKIVDIDVDDFLSTAGTLETLVEQELFFEEILSKLESDEREIFSLHADEALTHREIAGILSLPQSTVRWKYSNVVKKLKTILKDY